MMTDDRERRRVPPTDEEITSWDDFFDQVEDEERGGYDWDRFDRERESRRMRRSRRNRGRSSGRWDE